MNKFCLLMLLSFHFAYAGGLPDGTQALSDKLAVLQTFQGDFIQRLTEINGNLIQEATGTLYASNAGGKQGLLHWRTEAPMEQQVIGDGERIWLYDPDLLQVVVQQYPQNFSSTPALLLIGEVTHLAEQYQVVIDTTNSYAEYILIPRAEDTVYTQIVLRFEGNQPIGMILQDSLQQTTNIAFTNVTLNQPIDDSLFRFQVPDGVDLIRND